MAKKKQKNQEQNESLEQAEAPAEAQDAEPVGDANGSTTEPLSVVEFDAYMMLPVKLTLEEVEAKGKELVEELRAINTEEYRIKHEQKLSKEVVGKHEVAVRELSEQIRSGEETRRVLVEHVKNFTLNTFTVKRLDTGEVVSTRSLNPSERQQELKLEPLPPATEQAIDDFEQWGTP